MLKVLFAAAIFFVLSGCISSQIEASRADGECRGMGAQPGTDTFINCRIALQTGSPSALSGAPAICSTYTCFRSGYLHGYTDWANHIDCDLLLAKAARPL